MSACSVSCCVFSLCLPDIIWWMKMISRQTEYETNPTTSIQLRFHDIRLWFICSPNVTFDKLLSVNWHMQNNLPHNPSGVLLWGSHFDSRFYYMAGYSDMETWLAKIKILYDKTSELYHLNIDSPWLIYFVLKLYIESALPINLFK